MKLREAFHKINLRTAAVKVKFNLIIICVFLNISCDFIINSNYKYKIMEKRIAILATNGLKKLN
jgi:hypothetical protein